MEISVNGEQRSVAAALSVAALLRGMGLDGKRLAVERNGEIVPKQPPRRHGARRRRPPRDRRRRRRRIGNQANMNDQLIIAGKAYSLAPARSAPASTRTSTKPARAVEASGARDRHGRDPPHQHRPERRTSRACSTPCRPRNTPAAQHRRLLHARTTRCARCAWRANCSTATTWSSWKCWATRKTLFPNMVETLDGGRNAGEGRLQGDGLHLRRSDHRQAAGGNRLRRGDAAGLADRLRHGHPQSRGTCSSSSTTPRCR